MAKYSSKDVVIEFDNSSGVLQNMTQYILSINGVSIEALLEQSHSFGDSWEEHFSTGIKRIGEVVLGGMYDDTATTGPDAIFNAPGNTTDRTFKITWGGTRTTTFETVIRRYERQPQRGQMSMFEVALQPTGAATEA